MAGGDLLGPGVGFCLARLAGKLDLALGRERPDDNVEQVGGTTSVGRGDRVRLRPAQPVELGASSSRFWLSALLTTTITGAVERRRMRVAS